ncbi:MAG: hypothetical protein KAH54_11805, partial [Candidatus Sabulitectum sp.]|nr:hypothetical protein [Candidatus Sabulitectum sp.]
LFRAVTIEDLEASITDGYPMPWLAEILEDETIPWEDRYWLDCRMRSIFAQDLHLFFGTNGTPTLVEADYIHPGEDYWREYLLVNPVRQTDVDEELRPTMAYGEPGYIFDRYGRKIGELADVHPFTALSRDASIATVVSGGTTMESRREGFACFMYPDGSFTEVSLQESGDFSVVAGGNGDVVAFQCLLPLSMHDPVTYERTGAAGDVYFFDRNGNLLKRVSPPVIFSADERGKLSSNERYFCDALCTGELFLVDLKSDFQDNLIAMSEGGRGRFSFNFSPDGNFLCIGGFSRGLVMNLETSDTIWISNTEFVGINDNVKLHCSNDAEWITETMIRGSYPNRYHELRVYNKNYLIYSDTAESRYWEETILSPSGHFLLTQNDHVIISDTGIPTVIRQIRREGSE